MDTRIAIQARENGHGHYDVMLCHTDTLYYDH